jgi:hypothetical protein
MGARDLVRRGADVALGVEQHLVLELEEFALERPVGGYVQEMRAGDKALPDRAFCPRRPVISTCGASVIRQWYRPTKEALAWLREAICAEGSYIDRRSAPSDEVGENYPGHAG